VKYSTFKALDATGTLRDFDGIVGERWAFACRRAEDLDSKMPIRLTRIGSGALPVVDLTIPSAVAAVAELDALGPAPCDMGCVGQEVAAAWRRIAGLTTKPTIAKGQRWKMRDGRELFVEHLSVDIGGDIERVHLTTGQRKTSMTPATLMRLGKLEVPA
jgi:hypothetical protein